MRSIPAIALNSHARGARVQVRIYNDSSFIDVNTVEGWNLVQSVEVADSVDAAYMTARVDLALRAEGFNVSPLAHASALNRNLNPASSFSEFLRPGRRVLISAEAVPVDGTSPNTEAIFEGYIDEVDISGDSASLACTDILAPLGNTFIERERVYGVHTGGILPYTPGATYAVGDLVLPRTRNGTIYRVTIAGAASSNEDFEPDWNHDPTSGPVWFVEHAAELPNVPMEDVVAAILADNGISMVVNLPDGSPAFTILPYLQQRQSVLEAIQTLAAARGWTFKARFLAGTLRAALYGEDPTNTTTDATIPLGDQVEPPSVRWDASDMRNVVRVSYLDSSDVDPSGNRRLKWVESVDTASVAKFGRRFCEIVEGDDSPINSSAEAQRLADQVLSDLSAVACSLGVTVSLSYWFELGDLLEVEGGSSTIPDTTPKVAVVGYTHSIADGVGTTTLQLRGLRTVAVRKWVDSSVGAGSGVVDVSTLMTTSEYTIAPVKVPGGIWFSAESDAPANGPQPTAYEVHLQRTSQAGEWGHFTPTEATKAVTVSADGGFIAMAPLEVNDTYQFRAVPVFQDTDTGRVVRAGPTAAVEVSPGVVEPGGMSSESWARTPLNGEFSGGGSILGPAAAWEYLVGTAGEVSISSAAAAISGAGAAFFSGAFTSLAAKIRSRRFPAVEGEPLNVIATVRNTSSSASLRSYLAIQWFNASNVLLSTSSKNHTHAVANAWEKVLLQAVAPSGARWARVVVGKADAGAHSVFIDNVEAVRGWDRWHVVGAAGEPAFQNGWRNFDTATYQGAQFRLSDPRTVELRGIVAAGAPSTIFTLPPTHRPQKRHVLTAAANGNLAYVLVMSTGDVYLDVFLPGGTSTWVSLDDIRFSLD